MNKITSIKRKYSWLGVGIFITFLILQITIGYRFASIKENIETSHKSYQKEIILQNIYIEFLKYKNSKNKNHINKIREYLNKLGEPYRSRIVSYLPAIEEIDKENLKISKLENYLKNSIGKVKSEIKIVDNLDITKENIIMFIIILIINIIINLALYIFAKRIINNIDILQNGLVTFFDYLNRNISNPTKLDINSNDEFEIIADIINESIVKIERDLKKDKICVAEIRDVVHSMSEGDFSYRIHSSPANPEIDELKKSLNTFLDEMQKFYSSILSVLENYKQEDYTQRVSLKAKGEIEVLIEGVNELGDSLSNSAKLIAESLSEILQNNSNKLTENIDELSKTISQTDKNVDIATNQIDDIMQAIELTVNRTNQMKDVANKTSSSAEIGQKLAENTLNSMQEIYNSTNDISEAISVIDSIAFQTNILSLNAAVEAATAGEAGKGFAVVAQEVRNLANKSAEAAKKIKELVSKTQIKSTEGIEITENMKENFTSVVGNVADTLKLVTSVANEANEEMKKIESINKLIKHIDEMTNQNKEIMQNTYVVTYDLSKISNELYEQVKNKKFISDDNG